MQQQQQQHGGQILSKFNDADAVSNTETNKSARSSQNNTGQTGRDATHDLMRHLCTAFLEHCVQEKES